MKQTTTAMDDPIKSLSQYILRLLQHFQKIENYRSDDCNGANFSQSLTFSHEYGMPSHQWINKDAKSEFVAYLPELCKITMDCLKKDDMLLQLTSPAYVWGTFV